MSKIINYLKSKNKVFYERLFWAIVIPVYTVMTSLDYSYTNWGEVVQALQEIVLNPVLVLALARQLYNSMQDSKKKEVE